MKLILCMSLFTIGFASYCQQTIADFNLQGKIKKSMVIRSAISNEWPTDTASYLFNNDGVLIEEIEAHKHSMECTNIKTYDSKGHITLQECTGCKKSTKWVNTYNKAGLLTKIEVPFDLLTTTMSYDSLNNLTSVVRVDSSDLRGSIFFMRTLFKYDSQGNLLSKEIHQAERMQDSLALIAKENNTYNSSGKLTHKEEMEIKANKPCTTFSTYTYNNLEKLHTIKITHDDRSTECITTNSYENGRLISEISDLTILVNRQVKSYKKENHYDRFGNITKYVDLTISRNYSYKYDSNGNWIEKITFQEGFPLSKTVRIITYFD